jgi:hypothetical protein
MSPLHLIIGAFFFIIHISHTIQPPVDHFWIYVNIRCLGVTSSGAEVMYCRLQLSDVYSVYLYE